MKKSEMQEVTYGSYSFLRKPVLRTVGENKVRIGWIVTPNVPKDADAYELLSGMIEEGTLTRVQLAKAAFGQGFDLECRRKLTTVYLTATTEGYNKKAATDKYFADAFASEEVKNLLTPSEQLAAVDRYCKLHWIENDQENDDSKWDNSFTVNCWEL